MRTKIKNQRSKIKASAGFTIVELLIYLGLFTIFLTITTQMFTDSLHVVSESTSLSGIQQDGRFILSQMTSAIRKASSITTPSSNGATSQTLSVVINSNTNTYSVDENNNLVLTNNLGTHMLTSYSSSISAFTVTRLGNPGGVEHTLKISFTLSSREENATGAEVQTFQTTVAKRR